MYNYNHLYYFYITVKSGGVTNASKHLFISQPSLTSQLKVLEEYLQIKLFNKIGRKNELTTKGAIIFDFCRQMFELSEIMHETITEERPHASRKVYVGVSNEIANSFVVEVLSHFLNNYQEHLRPKVVMVSAPYDKLVEQLRFRELDLIVTSVAMSHPELENLQSIEVPVNLICTLSKKANAKQNGLDIKTLLELLGENNITDWVIPPQGYKLRSEINTFFKKNHIKGNIAFESDVIESLTRSVVDNVGVSLMPLIYIPKELENKSIYSFGPKNGYWKHQIWIASHQKNKDDKLIKSLSLSFMEVSSTLKCDVKSKR